MLRINFFDNEQIEAIVRDYRNAGLEPAEVALMAFAENITLHAYKITQQDIDEMRSHGFTDIEILDIIFAVGYRNFISRALDAVGYNADGVRLDKFKSLLGEKLFELLIVGRPISPASETGRN